MHAYEFFLAERLGMTHGELRTRMRSDELHEWLAFDEWRRDEAEWQAKKAEME